MYDDKNWHQPKCEAVWLVILRSQGIIGFLYNILTGEVKLDKLSRPRLNYSFFTDFQGHGNGRSFFFPKLSKTYKDRKTSAGRWISDRTKQTSALTRMLEHSIQQVNFFRWNTLVRLPPFRSLHALEWSNTSLVNITERIELFGYGQKSELVTGLSRPVRHTGLHQDVDTSNGKRRQHFVTRTEMTVWLRTPRRK